MNPTQTNEPTPGNGRRQLVLMALLFLGPVVAALGLYYMKPELAPTGSTAHGELINPVVQIPAIDAPANEGATFYGAWTLAVVAPGCDEACAESLLKVRQIRLALGRDMGRIARVLMLTAGGRAEDDLVAAHPDLRVVDDREPELLAQAERFPGNPGDSIYLVDPLGNLMMRFERGTESKAIKADLKRLLKLSSIG
ncbi:MAG: cytochrome C oxidase subunit I [Pseudomonadota bacterium]